MAIGRGGMTKELFGNRTTKMKSGGVVAPGDGAKKTTSAALHTAKTPALKEGGKVKNTRSPKTVNNSPKKPLQMYKTATGAQQYVKGDTYKERTDNVFKHSKGEFGEKGNRLAAAGYAQQAREIAGIVGPKNAKTNSTVAMYNSMEARRADAADAQKPGSKAKRGMKSGGTVSSKMK